MADAIIDASLGVVSVNQKSYYIGSVTRDYGVDSEAVTSFLSGYQSADDKDAFIQSSIDNATLLEVVADPTPNAPVVVDPADVGIADGGNSTWNQFE